MGGAAALGVAGGGSCGGGLAGVGGNRPSRLIWLGFWDGKRERDTANSIRGLAGAKGERSRVHDGTKRSVGGACSDKLMRVR